MTGWLKRLEEGADAWKKVATVASILGAMVGGAFIWGVHYATADIRAVVAEHEKRIGLQESASTAESGQIYNVTLMLMHISDALDEPAGSAERRSELRKARGIAIAIPYVKEPNDGASSGHSSSHH